jgi:hypothetical protein
MIPVMLTGVSSRTGAARADGNVGDQPWRPGLARRYWPALAVLAGIAALLYCAERQARQMGVQSDGAAMELQAWAMLHGNLLLHGWYLSDVSFYTTELPEYALVEIVRGLNPDVVRLAAALTYTLLVVLAAAVAYGSRPAAKRTAAVGAAITVVVMLGPTAAATNTLLNDPDHTGTAVPILLALLILDRGQRRWWGPALAAVVLGWALVGDSLVLLIGVVPLVVVGGMRAFGLAAIPENASVTVANFLKLFSADFFGARLNDWLLVTAVHLVFAGLVAAALVLALRGFRCGLPRAPDQDSAGPYGGQDGAADAGPGGGLVAQLLAVAIVINLVAYGLLYPGSLSTVREIAPVFGLGGALAGRMLGGPLVRRRLEPLLAIGAAAAIITLVSALVTVVPGQPAAASLARFLSAHHLRNGVAGYWDADSTTLVSRDRIVVRALRFRPGHGLALYLWEVDGGLLNPADYDVNFLVATAPTPRSAASVTPAEAIAQFGRPYRQYRHQGYVIMVWRKNLLRELGTYAPG